MKLSQKFRRVLRTVYLSIGAGAVSLLFIACYGMPVGYYDHYDYSTDVSSEECPVAEDVDEA